MPGGTTQTVLAAARANRALVALLGGYASFMVAEFGNWIVLLVYAYDRYGADGATAMVLVQLLPSMVLAPFTGGIADRLSSGLVLRASYVAQALALGGAAATVALDGPTPVVFVLASAATLVLDLTRPAQAALLPALVRTPAELTTANVLAGWIDGAGSLVGPAVAGVVLALGGITPAIALFAGANVVAAALVWRVRGLAPAGPAPVPDDGEAPSVLASLRVTVATPSTRLLLVFTGFYNMLVGALDLLCVLLAVSLLHLGSAAAGYLNATIGAGATVAGVLTFRLAGRSHLAPIAAGSLLAAVGALALIGAFPSEASAFALLALIGLVGTVFVSVSRTLLQRAAPADSTATTFAAAEAAISAGLVAGAVVVRVGLAIGGIRAALVAPAVLGGLLALFTWRHLRGVDATVPVPHVEIRLLRALSIFHALATPVVEDVARQLEPVPVRAGTQVVREGEPGDRYYAVADGRLRVSRQGRVLRMLGRGDGFGEIALVATAARTATVTAETDALLYALDKEHFVGLMTGNPSSGAAAWAVMSAYDDPSLAEGRSPPEAGNEAPGPTGHGTE